MAGPYTLIWKQGNYHCPTARKKKLRNHTTTKLFYDKWLYKLVVRNDIASIFRNKKLNYARDSLDRLQGQADSKATQLQHFTGYFIWEVSYRDFEDAKTIYKELTKFEDCGVRIETKFLSVYANDQKWLKKLMLDINPTNRFEWWEPNSKSVELLKSKKLVSNIKGYKYKVTLSDTTEEFGRWIKNNRDKIKIGNIAYQKMLNNEYANGYYFYVPNDKTLLLIELLLANKIRRVDELHGIDK